MIDPRNVLWAILAIALVTIVAAVVLIVTGHRDDLTVLLAFVGPILAALLAVKAELIHNRSLDAVEQNREAVNSHRDAMLAELESLKRPPESHL